LIDDAKRGLADIAAGRTLEADAALAQLQQGRKAATKLTAKQRG
jgi:predicted transcriptional regulator